MATQGPPWEGAQTVPLPQGPSPARDAPQERHAASPEQYTAAEYAAGQYPPQRHSPPGFTQGENPPDQYAPEAYPPGQYPPDRYAPEGYPGQYPPGQRPGGPGRTRRRRHRWLRRLSAVVLALFLLAALVFTALMLITPSVRNAPEIALSIDAAHHAVYPGPPVPSRFSAALTATEDHRFYSEPGIDPFAVARAVRGQITGQADQGGATLYQQLAKMLYTPGKSGWTVEVEQVVLGIKLNFTYPKTQILQMYADVAYFGNGYYGLPQASCGYFGVRPAQLSWPQAALLAGMVQAPSSYDPIVHYAAARARQAHVLSRLTATGALTQAQAAQAYRQPLHLTGHGTGCA